MWPFDIPKKRREAKAQAEAEQRARSERIVQAGVKRHQEMQRRNMALRGTAPWAPQSKWPAPGAKIMRLIVDLPSMGWRKGMEFDATLSGAAPHQTAYIVSRLDGTHLNSVPASILENIAD